MHCRSKTRIYAKDPHVYTRCALSVSIHFWIHSHTDGSQNDYPLDFANFSHHPKSIQFSRHLQVYCYYYHQLLYSPQGAHHYLLNIQWQHHHIIHLLLMRGAKNQKGYQFQKCWTREV